MPDKKYQVPVLEKTFTIIEAISQNPEGISFSGIIDLVKEPKATVYRILQTLENNSWIEKEGNLYHLGYMHIHYGLMTLAKRNIRTRALPIMEEMTQQLNESSHLALLSGKKSMIVEVYEGPQHIKPSSTIGTLLPMHCTSHGKVFLAFAIDQPIRDFYHSEILEKKTEHTITELEKLQQEIEKIKKCGYAVDDLEFVDDVRCLATPVWGPDRKCIGALGITATAFSFSRDKTERYAEIICSFAERLSLEMGGKKTS